MSCGFCGHETERTLGPRPDKPSMQDIIAVLAQAQHLDVEAARHGDPRCTVCGDRGSLWWTGLLAGDGGHVAGRF